MTPDLLSSRRLLGGGSPGEETAAVRRSMAARFQDPAQIRAVLLAARGRGFESLVSVADRRLFAAIGPRPTSELPKVLPIVPNIQGFMREAVERGLAGAGIARVRRMGLAPMIGLALRGASRAPLLLKRDFPTLLLCFIELELGEFRRHDPETIFLQAQMTDLAVAMNNPRPLAAYAGAVRRLTGARVGFMTQNFTALSAALARWGIEAAAAIAPWEASGALMRPAPEDCERSAASFIAAGGELWGDRAGRAQPPDAADRACAALHNLKGFLRDDNEALGLPAAATADATMPTGAAGKRRP